MMTAQHPYGDVDPWLVLIPAVLIVVLALVARAEAGSWLAPGPFFALVWSVLTWLPIVFVPEVSPFSAAVAWIALSAAVVCIGGYFGARVSRMLGSVAVSPRSLEGLPWLEYLVIGCAALGLLVVFLLLRAKGAGITALFSVHELERIGSSYSTDRYRHISEPIGPRILIPAVYTGAIMGGLQLARARSWPAYLIAVLPLGPALLIAVVESTRAAILFPLVLMAASYLSAQVTLRRGLRLFTVKRVLVGAATAVVLVGLSIAVLAVRYESSRSSIGALELVSQVRLDSLGYLPAFSFWFSHGVWASNQRLAWGSYSLSGLFDLLHLKSRVPGLYTDAISFGGAHGSTNIFTMFRGLIEDFGALGELVILLFAGLLCGAAHARAQAGDARYGPVLAAFYAVTMWSFIVDLFAYNTILGAWLIYAVYVVVALSIGKRRAVVAS